MKRSPSACAVGLVAVVVLLCLCPPWIGRSYHSSNGDWREGGVFGLQHSQWFILSPPRQINFGGSIHQAATVRWPGQPVSRREHVEIFLRRLVVQMSLAFVFFGLLQAITRARVPPPQRTAFDTLAATMALGIVGAWLALIAIGLFTAGHALTDGVVTSLLGLGFAGGLGFGLWNGAHERQDPHGCRAVGRESVLEFLDPRDGIG